MEKRNTSWAKIRENIIAQRLASLGVEAIALQALQDKIDDLEDDGGTPLEIEVDTDPIKYSPHYDAGSCIVVVESYVRLRDDGDVHISYAAYGLVTPEGIYDDVMIDMDLEDLLSIEREASCYHGCLIAEHNSWAETRASLERQFAV